MDIGAFFFGGDTTGFASALAFEGFLLAAPLIPITLSTNLTNMPAASGFKPATISPRCNATVGYGFAVGDASSGVLMVSARVGRERRTRFLAVS